MPEEKTAEAPAASAPENAEASKSENTLGQELSNALESGNAEASALEQVKRERDHWQKVASRQGGELGEVRKMLEEMRSTPATPAASGGNGADDSTFMFEHPEEWRKQLRDELRAEIMKDFSSKYEPDLDRVRQMNAAQEIIRSNPVAARLLQDQNTLAWLTQQSQDEDAQRSYSDPNRTRLEAALGRYLMLQLQKQNKVREAAPPPARPENAGLASPESPGGTPERTEEVPSDPEEAFRIFREKAAALRL